MTASRRFAVWAVTALGLVSALWVWWRFDGEMQAAQARVALGTVLIETPCSRIEHQEAGTGVPLLAIHGSGGGHDQGLAFARPLASPGIRVIAMSRFTYLRTPMPTDAAASGTQLRCGAWPRFFGR